MATRVRTAQGSRCAPGARAASSASGLRGGSKIALHGGLLVFEGHLGSRRPAEEQTVSLFDIELLELPVVVAPRGKLAL